MVGTVGMYQLMEMEDSRHCCRVKDMKRTSVPTIAEAAVTAFVVGMLFVWSNGMLDTLTGSLTNYATVCMLNEQR